MKSGRTLVELATEIQNQAQSKRDYIADTRTLELTDAGELAIDIDEPQALSVTEHTHSQIGDSLRCLPRQVASAFPLNITKECKQRLPIS